jgi:hypothetical protein
MVVLQALSAQKGLSPFVPIQKETFAAFLIYEAALPIQYRKRQRLLEEEFLKMEVIS